MKAGILAIGTELLMGQTVNTNATYLSKELNALGISVYYHYTIGDNPARIKKHLLELLENCDIVITTGGLGPTLDDITKEIIAETLNLQMKLDHHSLAIIKERFRLFNRFMPESNIRQAYFPDGAIILDNEKGTAPACIIETDNNQKRIIVLPGPPSELDHIYQTFIKPYLENLNQSSMVSKYLSVYDLGESSVEEKLIDLFNRQTNPTIATYAGDGKVLLRITSSGLSDEENNKAVDEMVSEVEARIGSYIVSKQGESIDLVVANLLQQKGLTIGFVESCTGGKLVNSIVQHPGSSQIVDSAYITYSNNSKMRDVNVSEATLRTYGAVSHQTCFEMVKGFVDKTNVDIAVSVTGITGPTGGTDEKPIGLVYIGLSIPGDILTFENNFTGDREMIQIRAVNRALKLIYDQLIKM